MNKLRLICTPYSFKGKLFEAYDDAFSMVNEADWICFMDGDTAFLEMSDFGHVLQNYIDKYPDTGMFTCYATRCHYARQTRKGIDPNSDSINYYALKTIEVRQKLDLEIKQMDTKVAGHLLMLKKSTWLSIKRKVAIRSQNKNILGFDSQLSYTLLENGYDIKLMRGVLLYHYLRKLTGKNNKIK